MVGRGRAHWRDVAVGTGEWIGEYRGAAGDARQIVAWRAAGYSVTRRNCESYGMSRRRWVWAVGLLKLARVLGDQVASADTFLLEDVEECAEAIERRAVRAVEGRSVHR